MQAALRRLLSLVPPGAAAAWEAVAALAAAELYGWQLLAGLLAIVGQPIPRTSERVPFP